MPINGVVTDCPINGVGQRGASRKILDWSHTSHQDKFQQDQTKHFKNRKGNHACAMRKFRFFFNNPTMKKTFLRKTEIPEAIKERIDGFDYVNVF